MGIQESNGNGSVTFILDGWLDTFSSPEAGVKLEAVTESAELVLDFDQVGYMPSAGLRQVLAANKKTKSLDAAFKMNNIDFCSK